MQVETPPEPVPAAALATPPRRQPVAAPATDTVAPVEVVAISPAAPVPAAAEVASVAPPDELAPQSAPALEPPPAPARRGPRAATLAIELPDLALPSVSSAHIRAELARRERRVATLLAEREWVISAMDEIEAALDAIGQ